MTVLRLLESIHGYFGVLAAVGLLHPAILMRKGKPLSYRNKLSIGLSAGFVVAAYVMGLVIYPDYRTLVKPELFLENYAAGVLFETKEHIAVGALSLAIGGAVCAFLAPRAAHALRKSAALAFAGAFTLCALTAGLGIYIAAVHTFGTERTVESNP